MPDSIPSRNGKEFRKPGDRRDVPQVSSARPPQCYATEVNPS